MKKSENVKKVRTKKKGTKTFTKDVNVGGRSSSRIKGIKPPDYTKETMECSLANTGPIVVEDVNENCVVYGEEDIEKYETADVGKVRTLLEATPMGIRQLAIRSALVGLV